jgi:hypothetical protein
MKNYVYKIGILLITLPIALDCFSNASTRSGFVNPVLSDYDQGVVQGADPRSQEALNNITNIRRRNAMVNQLMLRVNEYLKSTSKNYMTIEQAQNFVIEGMSLIDDYFKAASSNIPKKINQHGEMLNVVEFKDQSGFYAYNPEIRNYFLNVLVIQSDKFQGRYGGAIVYKSKGKVKIISTVHSFYPRGGGYSIENYNRHGRDVKISDYALEIIVMDPKTKGQARRKSFVLNENYMTDCKKRRDAKFYIDKCNIKFPKNKLDEIVNFTAGGQSLKPLQLISDEKLRRKKNVLYYMVTVGERVDGKVIRTSTKCNDVKLLGHKVEHKCNTRGKHSGGALVALIDREKYLVAIHRSGYNPDLHKPEDRVRHDKFNTALRVTE